LFASFVTVSLASLHCSPLEAQIFKKWKQKNSGSSQSHSGSPQPGLIAVPVALPPVSQQISGLSPQSAGGADTYYGKSNLIMERTQKLSDVDACAEIPGQKNFLNAIEGGVRTALTARQIESNPLIDDPYGLPGTANSHPVSLISNPICIQGAEQIEAIVGAGYVPDAATIEKLNKFSEASNKDRELALQGDTLALASFTKRMTQMMGCLAYAESLQTADNPGVDATFSMAVEAIPGSSKHFVDASGEIVRPSGVLFSEDRPGEYFLEQRKLKAAGALTDEKIKELKEKYKPWPVVGLYQFNPKFGNVGPCVQQWNKLVTNPVCQINGSSPADVMRALASPGQTFNAFCGVQKIVQSFNSQVNTRNGRALDKDGSIMTGVDISNMLPNGQIKAPQDRCVSLVTRSSRGRIYSHFGPWRNSVKDNMGKLINCVSTVTR